MRSLSGRSAVATWASLPNARPSALLPSAPLLVVPAYVPALPDSSPRIVLPPPQAARNRARVTGIARLTFHVVMALTPCVNVARPHAPRFTHGKSLTSLGEPADWGDAARRPFDASRHGLQASASPMARRPSAPLNPSCKPPGDRPSRRPPGSRSSTRAHSERAVSLGWSQLALIAG